MNTSTSTTASRVYAAWMPSGTRNCPSQPLLDVQAGINQSGHGRRQCERHVDERIQQPLAGKLVAHQHPGDQQARARYRQAADTKLAPIVSP